MLIGLLVPSFGNGHDWSLISRCKTGRYVVFRDMIRFTVPAGNRDFKLRDLLRVGNYKIANIIDHHLSIILNIMPLLWLWAPLR